VTEPTTLVLAETGIARLDDGSEAVNVGPIIAALTFLTEGRDDARGTDKQGQPLPDLVILAFDVVQSIILGGRHAEYFRNVKKEFDARAGQSHRIALARSKQSAVVAKALPRAPLEDAAEQLRTMLKSMVDRRLREPELAQLSEAIRSFREFGADRWVAATAHLLLACSALAPEPKALKKPATSARRSAARPAKPRAQARAASKKKPKKRAKS